MVNKYPIIETTVFIHPNGGWEWDFYDVNSIFGILFNGILPGDTCCYCDLATRGGAYCSILAKSRCKPYEMTRFFFNGKW